MIVQFDSETHGDGHAVGGPVVLIYGTEYELWLRIRDREMAPVDVESLGCSHWTAVVVPNLGTSEKELARSTMRENIAKGDGIGIYGLALASVEAYKFVAGRLRVPAFLCISGYIAEGDPTAMFRLNLPVCLQASSSTLHPVDLSSALLQRLEDGANRAQAFGDAAAAALAGVRESAEAACECAERAAELCSDARAYVDGIVADGVYTRPEIDSMLGALQWRDYDLSDSTSNN